MPYRSTEGVPARDRSAPRRGVTCLFFGLAWLAGAIGAVLAIPASPEPGPRLSRAPTYPYRDLLTFGNAFHAIRTLAIDVPGDGRLVDAAITGMVASLDRHSRYLTAEDFRRLDEQDTGSYAGIGLEVEAGGTVRRVLPAAPAARAGLRTGAAIESIDGAAVAGLGRDQIADRLRGEPGSAVRLRILHPGARIPAEAILIREWLPLHPVRVRALETVGYIGLDHFDAFTADRLLTAVATLRTAIGRDRLRGFVLDLRGNPGGLVVQAVAVAGAFLGHGEIVRLIGRGGNVERFALDERRDDLIAGLPLVVLVDGETASAAEIVAGALQDQRRATVIGVRTYGKGAVQTTYAHQSGRGLRLTTAWVVTPAGRRVEGNGIVPDRVVRREGVVPREENGPRERSGGGGTSLQDGIVADDSVDPARDRPLSAALRHLRGDEQAGTLTHRNDARSDR